MVAILDLIIFLSFFLIIYLFIGVISNKQMLNQVLIGLDNPKKRSITNLLNISILISFGFVIIDIIHIFLIIINWWDDSVAVPPTWVEVAPYIITEFILVIGFLIFEAIVIYSYQIYMKEYYLTQ